MKTMLKMKLGILAACAIVAGLAGPSALAQDTHVKIYGGAAYVAPMSDSSITVGSVTDTVKAEQQVGWNFGFEGRLGKLIGLELDYVNATQDVDYGGTVIGSTDFSPLTFTVNFHIVHTTIVDLYLGPSYAYVNWGDIKLNQEGQTFFSTTGLATDSAGAWGAGLGLDVGIGKHFAFTGGLRYLDVPLEVQGGQSASVNPLIARLGVALRF
jgi:outer membrane protein W